MKYLFATYSLRILFHLLLFALLYEIMLLHETHFNWSTGWHYMISAHLIIFLIEILPKGVLKITLEEYPVSYFISNILLLAIIVQLFYDFPISSDDLADFAVPYYGMLLQVFVVGVLTEISIALVQNKTSLLKNKKNK